jgi:predicted nucleotidyltransferase
MTVYDEVFLALEGAGVRYVVVGGVAVVLQGHARLTVDLDLVIDLAAEAAKAAIEALLGLGLRPRLPVDARDFADVSIRREWIEKRNLQVFSFYDPLDPFREVDLFAYYPLPFEDLLAEAQDVPLGAVRVRCASIPHLIELKRAAGRPQDLADVEALAALLEQNDG